MKSSTVRNWVVGVFVTLYVVVSLISTIHVVEFFKLSNPHWLAVSLAAAFEIGAAACLAAVVILDRTSRWMVWVLFSLITAMQVTGNVYYAYSNLSDFRMWAELFGLADQEPILQKRVISWISGGILPVVALGFVKSLVDYIRPSDATTAEDTDSAAQTTVPASADDPMDHSPEPPRPDWIEEFERETAPAPQDPPAPEGHQPKYGGL